MYQLIQGHESEERLALLFKLTKCSSQEMKAAVHCHLCKGRTEKDSAFLHDIPLGNLSRTLKRLNEVAAIVEQIKEIDWHNKQKLSVK